MALRSIENIVLPMIASFEGLIINGILNSILIFDLFGITSMEARGAALSTIIAIGVVLAATASIMLSFI